MQSLTCCVCNQPLADDAPRLGNRAYCPEHWAKLSYQRQSIGRSGLVYVVGVVLFAVLVAVLAALIQPDLSGSALVITGVILALVPAVLWLAFFYSQDRLEPEPKTYVIGVAVLGALLASAVGIPLVRDLFRVQDWLGQSMLVTLLGSILVVGFTQEFLKYAAVRYSIYLSSEFDERLDGVLYGTAAGLGYATMLNIHYVVESGGVDLAMGITRIVITALAQASFAGISGYFLGRAKFEEEPVWWLPAGLTLAAALNGVFSVVLGGLTRSGSVMTGQTVNPWYGLVLAAIVAGVTMAVLVRLMQRASRLTLSGADLP